MLHAYADKLLVKDGINIEFFKCFEWVKPQQNLLFYKPVKHLLKFYVMASVGCPKVYLSMLASHNKEK